MDKMKKHKKPAIFAGSSLIVSVMVICLCFCGFSSPKNQYFALEKKNIQSK